MSTSNPADLAGMPASKPPPAQQESELLQTNIADHAQDSCADLAQVLTCLWVYKQRPICIVYSLAGVLHSCRGLGILPMNAAEGTSLDALCSALQDGDGRHI